MSKPDKYHLSKVQALDKMALKLFSHYGSPCHTDTPPRYPCQTGLTDPHHSHRRPNSTAPAKEQKSDFNIHASLWAQYHWKKMCI